MAISSSPTHSICKQGNLFLKDKLNILNKVVTCKHRWKNTSIFFLSVFKKRNHWFQIPRIKSTSRLFNSDRIDIIEISWKTSTQGGVEDEKLLEGYFAKIFKVLFICGRCVRRFFRNLCAVLTFSQFCVKTKVQTKKH